MATQTNKQLSPHFRESEFRCRCCGNLPPGGVPQSLLDVLEDVRTHFDSPTVINSGYRCQHHNANVGGAPNSQHITGRAADIAVRDVPASEVYAYLDPKHTGGLGRYNTFTHVDTRDQRTRWRG